MDHFCTLNGKNILRLRIILRYTIFMIIIYIILLYDIIIISYIY